MKINKLNHPRKHPCNARVTYADELGARSKNKACRRGSLSYLDNLSPKTNEFEHIFAPNGGYCLYTSKRVNYMFIIRPIFFAARGT